VLTLKYYDGGVERALDLMVDAARDLNPIFRQYIKWLRPQIQKEFDEQGPGWRALADSTMEARQANLEAVSDKIRKGAVASVGRRLASDERRVLRRLNKRQENLTLSRSIGLGANDRSRALIERARKAADRQAVIRAEFERITRGELGPARKEAKALLSGGPGDGGRLGRAAARADEKIERYKSGHLLGQIASSITYEISPGTLTVFSRIPWAGIHNEGGTAGRGAQIPKRAFLYWTPERIAALAEIAAKHIASKAKK